MRRVIIAGVVLGLLAVVVSWFNDDEFCKVAADDGLSAEGIKAGKQYKDEREDFSDRLDDASASAPDAVADEVETIEDAMEDARNPSAVSSRKIDSAYDNIAEWVAANCEN